MAYLRPPPSQCGIYYRVGSTSDFQTSPAYRWLPLSNLSAKAHIQHYSAGVTLYQTFVVPPTGSTSISGLIESAKYSFPIHPACSVNSFKAHIHSPEKPVRTIRGIIKPLQKARKIYDKAVSEGKTAGLLEQRAPDVFLMKLGNLPSSVGTEVKVEISYVVELSHDSEVDGVKFIVPMAIAPRYGEFTPWNSGDEIREPSGLSTASWGSVLSHGIDMEVKVSMPGPVTGIQSPSHPISVTIGSHATAENFDKTRAMAKLEMPDQTFLGKDFVLHILCNEAAAPRAILEKCSPEIANTSALMLTFVPKFVVPPTAAPSSLQLKKPRKEIIFLIDRSGSMYDKVNSLRSALTVFIKSLPTNQNIVFDICSFGSRHKFLFHGTSHNGVPVKGAQVYNQETMEKALALAKTVAADFGGTELAEPIKVICEMTKQREEGRRTEDDVFETEILVLTDGEIWEVEKLCDYVREHTKGWRRGSGDNSGVRIFTLGIGEDVSHALVESLAKAGGGYSAFVTGNERYEGKVVRMLKAALSERLGNFKLFWEDMEKWGLSKLDSSASPPYAASAGDTTEDFEIIDAPKDREVTRAPSTPAPINLYDPTADVDAPLETTHKPIEKDPVPHLQPPVIIQAPHTIPPLFPFSRTNVYVLLTPPQGTNPPPPEKLTLRGFTVSGQPLELALPVTVLDQPGTTIHQLATKKYLDDLREGDSWIHDAQKCKTKVRCTYIERDGNRRDDFIELPESNASPFGHSQGESSKVKLDDIIVAEGERVGVDYSVAGKWTAFVAVEGTERGNEQPKEVDGDDPEPVSADTKSANPMTLVAGCSALPAPRRAVLCSSFAAPAFGFQPMSFQRRRSTPKIGSTAGQTSGLFGSMARHSYHSYEGGDSEEDEEDEEDKEDKEGKEGKEEEYNEEGREKATPTIRLSPPEQATTLIAYQQFEGYWSLKKSQGLINFLERHLPVSRGEKEIKGDGSDLWTTVLVLVFLERCLNGESEKEVWELVGEKGWEWVRGAVGEDEEKLQKIKDDITAKYFSEL